MSFGQPPPGGGFGSGGSAPGGGPGEYGGGFGPPGAPFGSPPGQFGFPGSSGPPGGGPQGLPPAPETDVLAIVATVLGALSLLTCFCCGIFSVPIPIAAAICGGISLRRQSTEPDRFSSSSKPLAIAGIALGVIVVLLSILAAVVGFGSQLLQQAQQL